jgi:hypothetical protein
MANKRACLGRPVAPNRGKMMQPMGTLQLGLPSPTAIPLQNYLYIIDLEDFFFTIPLHPEDRENFTFSLLFRNHQAP